MIYKVIFNFADVDIFEKISKKYNIYYTNSVLYLYSRNFEDLTEAKIKRSLKVSNVYILKIDETNLKYEPVDVQNWCRDAFVERDLKNYERDNQEEIKNYMKILDDFERKLQDLQLKGE